MNLYSKIKPDLFYFLKSIENYNEVPFNKHIKKKGVSVGFVYKELCEDFNMNIIHNIEQCLALEKKVKGSKTFSGWFNMSLGRGGRDDVRSFSEEYTEGSVFSISMIKDELYRIMKKMEKLSSDIDNADKTNVKAFKTKHDKFGHLNAVEWYNLGMNNLEVYKDLKEKLDKSIGR